MKTVNDMGEGVFLIFVVPVEFAFHTKAVKENRVALEGSPPVFYQEAAL